MDRNEIRSALEKSSLKGLVPSTFEIVGSEIEWIPSKAFWARWHVDENWLRAIGVRTYAIPRYRKPKPHEWRARVVVSMLDTITRKCKRCGVLVDDRGHYCDPCWKEIRNAKRV